MTTYKNLQQLRPYYVFDDVDVDRYIIDGITAGMLSARRLIRPSYRGGQDLD